MSFVLEIYMINWLECMCSKSSLFNFFISPLQEKAQATYVGYANLPNQVFRKAVKKGFQFSLMVVGKSSISMERRG